MSDLSQRFESATLDSRQLPERPGNEDLLRLYALYKQATVGDVTGDRPGMMDFVGRAKFDAWEELAGTGTDDAMERYIELVESLKGTG